ncbi:MAG: sigma-70 family RNA polymerase sigma factor [Planctomycetes bacterium]|nr:sigma-70 family RNA polymerase sigma factor [Planctomycetota bacterium]
MPPSHTEQVQQLFVRHSGLLHGSIASQCGDLVLAEDILQEVFLVVTSRADSFELGTNFLAWARAIARFKTMELMRERQRDRATLSDEALAALEALAPDVESWQSQREALHRCLEQLPPAQRQLTALAYGDGLTPAEIAERSGKAANVVHVLMSRVRRILRECVFARLGLTP